MSLQSLILLIEDEMPIRRVLRHALQDQGYATIEAATAADGLFQASMRAPNLILLDLGLPDIDGTEVTSILRRSQQVPIIVVSAREAEGDQIAALDAGANDYITKPFREGELLARVRAALRHGAHTGKPAQVFSNGRLSVDFTAHNVMLDGTRVDLTPKEYKLLALLVRQPGSVITHKNLLREIWGAAYVREVQYLRVFMRQLRAKLERDPSRPEMLLTAAGVGYRFRSDD